MSNKHKHKHKDTSTHRIAYLTQFSIPAPHNPMINKMADKDDILCLCRPRSHQSKLRHKHKHKKSEHVLSSSAYAYAYVAGVLTCFHRCLCVCLCLCLCLCASENLAFHADVRRGSSRVPAPHEPMRTSAQEASENQA